MSSVQIFLQFLVMSLTRVTYVLCSPEILLFLRLSRTILFSIHLLVFNFAIIPDSNKANYALVKYDYNTVNTTDDNTCA